MEVTRPLPISDSVTIEDETTADDERVGLIADHPMIGDATHHRSCRYFHTITLCTLLGGTIILVLFLFVPTKFPIPYIIHNNTSPSADSIILHKNSPTLRPTRSPRNPRYCDLHSSPPLMPKCYLNNSYCGDWNVTNRTFIPAVNPNTHLYDKDQCQLRLFTPAEARQCIGNRTLAFMGDSMIRDLTTGIGLFLQGMTVEESLDIKFDHQDKFALDGWIDMIPYLEMWGVDQGAGWVFPSSNRSHFTAVTNRTPDADHYNFQIQFWALYNNDYLYSRVGTSKKNHLTDVLNGTVLDDPMMMKVGGRKMDYLFWSYGLHDWGWWMVENQDIVKNFYNNIHGHFRANQANFPCPAAWVSLNSNCDFSMGNGVVGGHSANYQVVSIDRLNRELGGILRAEHLPYYDADLVLRSPELCNVTGDGM